MAQNQLQTFRRTKERIDSDITYHREVLRLVKLRSESGQQLTQAENTVIALRRSISDALDTLEQVSGFFGTLASLGDAIVEQNTSAKGE